MDARAAGERSLTVSSANKLVNVPPSNAVDVLCGATSHESTHIGGVFVDDVFPHFENVHNASDSFAAGQDCEVT